MWILALIGYLGHVVGFILLTLSIASGLYYLSELVEEHTVVAKRFLMRIIYAVMALLALLCLVDKFPVWKSAVGIVSHAVYLGNMRAFPYVKMTDPLFLASCVIVLFNHWLWMGHFSLLQQAAYTRMTSRYEQPDVPSFAEVASFFGLCVWLVPFALFVSLSAGENVLPTMGTETPRGVMGAKPKRQGMVKALVDSIRGAIADATGRNNKAGPL